MFPNLMVIIKSMSNEYTNEYANISVKHYSDVNYFKALELAIKQTPGDPIYIRIKQTDKKNLNEITD